MQAYSELPHICFQHSQNDRNTGRHCSHNIPWWRHQDFFATVSSVLVFRCYVYTATTHRMNDYAISFNEIINNNHINILVIYIYYV